MQPKAGTRSKVQAVTHSPYVRYMSISMCMNRETCMHLLMRLLSSIRYYILFPFGITLLAKGSNFYVQVAIRSGEDVITGGRSNMKRGVLKKKKEMVRSCRNTIPQVNP